jgi:hypothetical protein
MFIKFLQILLVATSAYLYSQEEREGKLPELIENIRDAMPLRDSFGFVIPSVSDQEKFAEIIDLITLNQFSKADSVAKSTGYVIYKWKDTSDNDKIYYILMEPSADIKGGVSLGWGTYIYNENGSNKVAVEVPHPIWDTNTWEVGFRGYQQTNAKFFLMAGTHRYANGRDPAPADPAHNTQNIFYTVHTQIANTADHVFQFHGFNSSNDNYDGYPNVILSNGTSSPSQILNDFKTEINVEGFSVGIFDGINYSLLGATTNTQGKWSNQQNLSFVHCEIDYFIRTNVSNWENFIDAFIRTFKEETVPVEDESAINSPTFYLAQNYPNPFNPRTIITYQLNKNSFVELIIYDNLGRRIETLISENQHQGNYSISVNFEKIKNNLPSGVYLYNLLVDKSYSISKKMIYLK